MARRDSSVDLIFGLVGLIADIAITSSRNRNYSSSINANKGKTQSMSRLFQMKEDHKTGGGPVFEPMKNRPVNTVSKEARFAAMAAIKSGKTMTKADYEDKPQLNRTVKTVSKEDRYAAMEAIKSERKNDTVDHKSATTKTTYYGITDRTKQLKLEILLLTYMYEEDDGKISRKESRAIRNHYKGVINDLSEEDIEYIKDIKNMDRSLLNIRSFISQQEVTDTEITNSIRTLKICNKDPKKYDSIIQRIENTLLETMGY